MGSDSSHASCHSEVIQIILSLGSGGETFRAPERPLPGTPDPHGYRRLSTPFPIRGRKEKTPPDGCYIYRPEVAVKLTGSTASDKIPHEADDQRENKTNPRAERRHSLHHQRLVFIKVS